MFCKSKDSEQCALFVYQSNPFMVRNQNLYTIKISEQKKTNEFFSFLLMELDNIVNTNPIYTLFV